MSFVPHRDDSPAVVRLKLIYGVPTMLVIAVGYLFHDLFGVLAAWSWCLCEEIATAVQMAITGRAP